MSSSDASMGDASSGDASSGDDSSIVSVDSDVVFVGENAAKRREYFDRVEKQFGTRSNENKHFRNIMKGFGSNPAPSLFRDVHVLFRKYPKLFKASEVFFPSAIEAYREFTEAPASFVSTQISPQDSFRFTKVPNATAQEHVTGSLASDRQQLDAILDCLTDLLKLDGKKVELPIGGPDGNVVQLPEEKEGSTARTPKYKPDWDRATELFEALPTDRKKKMTKLMTDYVTVCEKNYHLKTTTVIVKVNLLWIVCSCKGAQSLKLIEIVLKLRPEAAKEVNNNTTGNTPLAAAAINGAPEEVVMVLQSVSDPQAIADSIVAQVMNMKLGSFQRKHDVNWDSLSKQFYGLREETATKMAQSEVSFTFRSSSVTGNVLWFMCGVHEGPPIGIASAVLKAWPDAVRSLGSTTSWCSTHSTPLFRAIDRCASYELIALLVDEWVGACKVRGHDGLTPLSLAISKRNFMPATVVNKLVRACPNAARMTNDFNRKTPLHLAIEPGFGDYPRKHVSIELIFNAFREGVNQKGYDGRSAFSIVVSRLWCAEYEADASYSSQDSDFEGINPSPCLADDLKSARLFLDGLRDGRELQPFLNDRNDSDGPRLFFSLMQSKAKFNEYILDHRKTNLIELNLNDEPVQDWPMLLILVDFDTEEAWNVFNQIRELKGDLEQRMVTIKSSTDETLATFFSTTKVSESIWHKVADRAKGCNHPQFKKWGESYGRLFGKYRIHDKKVKHESATCVVVFATHIDRDDNRKEEKTVALKFMSDYDAFKRELKTRSMIHQAAVGGEGFVVMVTDSFTEEKMPKDSSSRFAHHYEQSFSELKHYQQIILKGDGSVSPRHLIVMDCGYGDDLSDVISHKRIAKNDIHLVSLIALNVAMILQFLNERCHVIHGDVKPRNFIVWNAAAELRAIDLDNASAINNDKTDHKSTSSGYLPPEQATVVFARRQGVKPDVCNSELENEIRDLESKLKKVQWDETLTSLVQKEIKAKREKLTCLNYNEKFVPEKVMAHKTFDMWCFGVLLYKLCTGFDLFEIDDEEQISKEDQEKLMNWRKEELLAKLNDHMPDNKWRKRFGPVLIDLLQKEPKNRPKNWQFVIDRLEKEIDTDKVEGKLDELLTLSTSHAEDLKSKLNELLALSSPNAPRYMLFIPQELEQEDKWKLKHLCAERVRVVFMCPLALIIPRDETGAPAGYDLLLPKKWFEQYGPAIRITLMYLSLALKVYTMGLSPFVPSESIQGARDKVQLDSLALDVLQGKINALSQCIGINDTLHKGADTGVDKMKMEESSYADVKQMTKGDPEFLKSGLVRAYCKHDNSVDYVLPAMKKRYEEHGKSCLFRGLISAELSVAMKGHLTVFRTTKKKRSNKPATVFCVLRIDGVITRYKNEAEYNADRLLALGGKTKPRFDRVEYDKIKGEVSLHFIDQTMEVFLGTSGSTDEMKRWNNEFQKYVKH